MKEKAGKEFTDAKYAEAIEMFDKC